MSIRDIGLFLKSASTDAAIAKVRATLGSRAAFESIYERRPDPWASADRRYRYQRRKYDGLMSVLPVGRRFARILDLGSGVGELSRLLSSVGDDVLGLDIAQSAVDHATTLGNGVQPRFAQGDLTDLPRNLDGQFDLVVVADTIYYLEHLDDMSLKAIATRVADLVAPGGLCLIANHFFFSRDKDSRVSRRIHQAFAWSPRFQVMSDHRRAFYLATLLQAT